MQEQRGGAPFPTFHGHHVQDSCGGALPLPGAVLLDQRTHYQGIVRVDVPDVL